MATEFLRNNPDDPWKKAKAQAKLQARLDAGETVITHEVIPNRDTPEKRAKRQAKAEGERAIKAQSRLNRGQ